jgi:hypothetical protein
LLREGIGCHYPKGRWKQLGGRQLGARLARRGQGQAEQRRFEKGGVETRLHRSLLRMDGPAAKLSVP